MKSQFRVAYFRIIKGKHLERKNHLHQCRLLLISLILRIQFGIKTEILAALQMISLHQIRKLAKAINLSQFNVYFFFYRYLPTNPYMFNFNLTRLEFDGYSSLCRFQRIDPCSLTVSLNRLDYFYSNLKINSCQMTVILFDSNSSFNRFLRIGLCKWIIILVYSLH